MKRCKLTLASLPLLVAALLAVESSVAIADTVKAEKIDSPADAELDRFSIDRDWQEKLERITPVDRSGHRIDADLIAQNAPEPAAPDAFASADEAARQSSNPLGGDFMILLNQFDNYFLQGDLTDKTRHLNTWSIQPVVPIRLGGDWIMVNRPTFPVILNADVPDQKRLRKGLIGGGGLPPDNAPDNIPFTGKSGFGDIVHFSLAGQSLPTEKAGGGDAVWALGPTFMFPTANDDALGTDKYSAGPAGVVAFIGRDFIVGALGQHWWSYASADSDRDDVDFTWLNLFYFLNFEDGWQVGGTPVVTADWEADSDNRWSVPIGLGVYKTHFFGKFPIKFGIETQYYPVRPDNLGEEFNIRFVVAPIFPNFIGNLFQ